MPLSSVTPERLQRDLRVGHDVDCAPAQLAGLGLGDDRQRDARQVRDLELAVRIGEHRRDAAASPPRRRRLASTVIMRDPPFCRFRARSCPRCLMSETHASAIGLPSAPTTTPRITPSGRSTASVTPVFCFGRAERDLRVALHRQRPAAIEDAQAIGPWREAVQLELAARVRHGLHATRDHAVDDRRALRRLIGVAITVHRGDRLALTVDDLARDRAAGLDVDRRPRPSAG